MKLEKHVKDYFTAFILENKKALDNNEFDFLYDKLYKQARYILTLFLLAANINPLPYMTFIPSYFLADQHTLKEIKIPGNIKYIEQFAIQNCDNLESIIIQDGVEMIFRNAFYSLNKLKYVNIANSVEHMENNLFYNCFYIKDIILPEDMKDHNIEELTGIHYKTNISFNK